MDTYCTEFAKVWADIAGSMEWAADQEEVRFIINQIRECIAGRSADEEVTIQWTEREWAILGVGIRSLRENGLI